MTIRHLSQAIILGILFLSLSCEKNADNVVLPDYTPKLVIHAFISPSDTLLVANVGTTSNIYGKQTGNQNSLPIKVELIDGENIVFFSDRDEAGNCSVKYTVKAGKEYKILAKCPGFPDASGVCKVPDIKNLNISVDTVTVLLKVDTWNYNSCQVKVKFTDIPNESNYYGIYEVEKTNDNDPALQQSIPLYISGTYNFGLVMSDHLIDGKDINATFISFNGFDLSSSYLQSMELVTYVLLTDAEYYKYYSSLSKYNSSDNPFTEFSPVYSNIQGGYGIFGSYVKYQKTLKLK